MKKSCCKCAPKVSLGHFFILVNNPKQPLHARNYFKNKILWKRLSECLKKLNFFSLTNPVPFDGQDYEKQDGPSDQPLFELQKKFRKIPLLVINYLTKFADVM